jgi:hypothetical protein
LALTSPTSGGRSVSIVRSLTQVKEFLSLLDDCLTLFEAVVLHFANPTFEFTGLAGESGQA